MSQLSGFSDLRSDLQELGRAIDVIEKHYPDFQINLVPRKALENGIAEQSVATGGGSASTTPSANGKRSSRKRGNRTKVAEACRGRWMSLAAIRTETGLSSTQVHGAMLGKDGHFQFERRLMDANVQNGPKEYRLKD